MKSLGLFLEWLLMMAALLCGVALSVTLLGIARYVSLVYLKIGTFK